MRRRLATLGAAIVALGAVAGGALVSQPQSHARVWTSQAARTHPTHTSRRFASFSPTGYSITLNWTAIPFASRTGYFVTEDGAQVADVTSTSYTFTNLACGATHTLGVQAHDGSGGTGQLLTTPYTTPACPGGGGGGSFSCPSGVRCFYVSTSGSDSNTGTDEAHPWAHAPGMPTFTGSYTHQAGDELIFRGGDTWGNGNFPLIPTGSGNATHLDYYGVDPNWPSSGWTQPVFDAGGLAITGAYDGFVQLSGRDYIEVDDIHMNGLKGNGSTACGAVNLNNQGGSGDQNIVVNRIVVDHFTISASDNCTLVGAYSGSPWAGNSVVENSTFTNTGFASYGTGVSQIANSLNNTFDGMVNDLHPTGTGGTISGNRFLNCGNPYPPDIATSGFTHSDMMQLFDGTTGITGTWYFDDNVFDGNGSANGGAAECESSLFAPKSGTIYIWNNVYTHLNAASPDLDFSQGSGTSYYIWNNSIGGGAVPNGNYPCLMSAKGGSVSTLVWQNNFCVTQAFNADSQGIDTALSATTKTEANNVKLTSTAAASDGFSAGGTYAWQPPSGNPPTNSAGSNLTATTPGCGTSGLSGLCSTTSYAGQLTTSSRPTSGAWNAGAY